MAASSGSGKSTRRDPSPSTVKALFALSRGYCYWPGCTTRVVRMHRKIPIIVVEIAHVVAASDAGPRADRSMREENRKDFSNLVLLCKFHHTVVDGEATRDEYTIELLTEWKTARESGLGADLSPLEHSVGEDDLEAVLKAAVTDVVDGTKAEVLDAIERLEMLGQESVRLLRALVDEVFDRPYIDLDAVASLAESAQLLEHLPATAGVLHESSQSLRHLPDTAEILHESSGRLVSTTDYIGLLYSAAEQLRNLPDHAGILSDAAYDLRNLSDIADNLSRASESISRAMREISSFAPDHVYLDNVNAATTRLTNASGTFTESIRAMEDAAALALQATTHRPPDRLTYVLRGMAAGAFVVILAVVVIWLSVKTP